MANGQFVKLAQRFTLMSHDSIDSRSELSKRYGITGQTRFLLLDSKGVEIGRISKSGRPLFDKVMIASIEKMETSYYFSQRELFEYLLTYIDSRKTNTTEINKHLFNLDASKYAIRETASRMLFSLGEPAYQSILKYKPTSSESRYRISALLKKLKSHHHLILRKELDHNIDYLVFHLNDHPRVSNYLKRILPQGVRIKDAKNWWLSHGQKYDWNVNHKRFILRHSIKVSKIENKK